MIICGVLILIIILCLINWWILHIRVQLLTDQVEDLYAKCYYSDDKTTTLSRRLDKIADVMVKLPLDKG